MGIHQENKHSVGAHLRRNTDVGVVVIEDLGEHYLVRDYFEIMMDRDYFFETVLDEGRYTYF